LLLSLHLAPFRLLVASLLLSTALTALAETLAGEVVGLADGDTLTVLDQSKAQHRIRLAGIDAPEKRQPFGDRSRQHLASLTFRKQVVVDWHKADRYGRIVGKVTVGEVDVGLEQVRAGMAWHYKAYEREQSPEDRATYAAAEEHARAGHLGLWRETGPLPPWDFRRNLLQQSSHRPADKREVAAIQSP
jgi:endonuclease YncB( thermonuclease family)